MAGETGAQENAKRLWLLFCLEGSNNRVSEAIQERIRGKYPAHLNYSGVILPQGLGSAVPTQS